MLKSWYLRLITETYWYHLWSYIYPFMKEWLVSIKCESWKNESDIDQLLRVFSMNHDGIYSSSAFDLPVIFRRKWLSISPSSVMFYVKIKTPQKMIYTAVMFFECLAPSLISNFRACCWEPFTNHLRDGTRN